MKNSIITLILFLLFNTGFSQKYKFEYTGRLTPTVIKDKLSQARFISDIVPDFCRYLVLPFKERDLLDQLLDLQNTFVVSVLLDHQRRMLDYPKENDIYAHENFNEIIDYVSVEILSTCDGKTLAYQSTSDTLTTEQRNSLMTADLGTDINIKIKFKYKNEEYDKLNAGNEIKDGEFLVTVIPETEAEYPGGFKQISQYFMENVIDRISEPGASEKIAQAILKFTVNEEGQIVGANIFKTSTDPQIDKLLLDATNKMPKWRPAKNSKGLNVKQEFSIPFGGGC